MSEIASNEVTALLGRATDGDPAAPEALLPLVYEQLRRLAERQMEREPAGHTLQPTALVHEAYLRLVGAEDASWNSRGHFYGAAARAMRRILVERARRYGRARHGGGRGRVPLAEAEPAADMDRMDFIALDEALDRLQTQDGRAAEIVMLRYFAGLTEEQVARALGVSRRTVQGDWRYARVWLFAQLSGGDDREP